MISQHNLHFCLLGLRQKKGMEMQRASFQPASRPTKSASSALGFRKLLGCQLPADTKWASTSDK